MSTPTGRVRAAKGYLLLVATEKGHEGAMRLLLEREGVNPNMASDDLRTPFAVTLRYGHEGVVKLLLKPKDLNPNLPGIDGRTPLSFVVRCGLGGIVKLLLERVDAKVIMTSHRSPSLPSLVARESSSCY